MTYCSHEYENILTGIYKYLSTQDTPYPLAKHHQQ